MKVIKTERVCFTEKEQNLWNEFYNMMGDILSTSEDELLDKASRNILDAMDDFMLFFDKRF